MEFIHNATSAHFSDSRTPSDHIEIKLTFTVIFGCPLHPLQIRRLF